MNKYKKALFFEALDGASVKCGLCRHHCQIPVGGRGICKVRENRGGILYSLNYSLIVAEHVDPVEKKPLFHYLPASRTYSIAAMGCNFTCHHCQNFSISQLDVKSMPEGVRRTSHQIITAAKQHGALSISYTYTEPTIFFETVLETAESASKEGLGNILVTNGYIESEPLRVLAPYINAANIDLKGFNQQFYSKVCGASLKSICKSLKEFRKYPIWLEITTLLIPGMNDNPAELKDLARFISDELGEDTIWHISKFYPTYKMTDVPPTPESSIERAVEAGKGSGLKYIYTGNIRKAGCEDTLCPKCNSLLIRRSGFTVVENLINNGFCDYCNEKIAGVWG